MARPPRGERRAIFFDRDGTLNEEVGYINHIERLRVFPNAARAVRAVNQAGWLSIVITNQSGIARGHFAESLLKKVHVQLRKKIAAGGAKLDDIIYCPHHPEGILPEFRLTCDCRKPAPGMLHSAAARHGIDLPNSYVIGDRYVDILMARRAGARSVLVLTGFGLGEWEFNRSGWEHQPDYVAENVYQAVRWALRHSESVVSSA
ncbi:MAG: D,D-heptose 1,7-bisphosphate phosphatase [Acidobacteria bacterium RIFCSPLOWO2_12_FULL_54_10]|nr:MAG: D,D-heptose 1,7-bisphosphate phosphatase [Acidobacteria bacterium RIFCSPLOWO2_12_FULL_54_10]